MTIWRVRDRGGREIYLTEERWKHMVTSHPDLEDRREAVLETVRKGRREQDPILPYVVVVYSIAEVSMNKKIDYEYLEDADILEIFFERGPATGTVQIADHVTLRFRKKERRALSLILENFTYLTQVVETGPRSFPLKIDQLPPDWRRTVLHIVTTAPVNQYLKVLSYQSPRARRTVPIAFLSQSPSLFPLRA